MYVWKASEVTKPKEIFARGRHVQQRRFPHISVEWLTRSSMGTDEGCERRVSEQCLCRERGLRYYASK